MQCVLVDFSTVDRRERGRYVEVSFVFVVSGDILFPTSAQATGQQVNGAAGALEYASSQDFSRSVADLQRVPQLWIAAVPQFGALATTAVNDPARALSAVAGLQGYFGRYSSGRLGTLQPPSATVQSLLSRSVTSRQGVLAAVAGLNLASEAL